MSRAVEAARGQGGLTLEELEGRFGGTREHVQRAVWWGRLVEVAGLYYAAGEEPGA